MLTTPAMRNPHTTPVPKAVKAAPPRMKTLEAGEIDDKVMRILPPSPRLRDKEAS